MEEQIPVTRMDASTQIQRLQEFFETQFHAELLEHIRKGNNKLIVDFDMLAKFDPELATLLLEEPENTLKACEIAVEQLEGAQGFTVRFRELPSTQEIPIRHLRSRHLEKMIQLLGIVRQKSDVRPQVTSARFECPSCGNIISMLQLDAKFREPDRCGCGRKGKFRLLSKELVDAQKIVLEESPDDLEGGEQPKRLNIFLRKDLVAPITDAKTNPGSKVCLTGYLKEVPITLSTGGQSTRYDLILESNHIEPVEEDYTQINLDPADEQAILELSREDGIFEKLSRSLAPAVYGHEKIKQAIMLQLFGGVKKKRSDGNVTRGDLHILLVGDPGSGKSSLLKRCQVVAPKSRFVSGKGASAAGLTASVVRDDFLKGWALEAGALVLANRGFCMIDELDKMSAEDRSAFHEALESQCYHYDTELMLSDGSVTKIGQLLDEYFEEHEDQIKQGINCEILPASDLEVLTTDFQNIFPVTPKYVSRHKAPSHFLRITFSNGRQITVTPEHPLFVHQDGMTTVHAHQAEVGMLAPAPRQIPSITKQIPLLHPQITAKQKTISFPRALNKHLAGLLGYLASEGHSYIQRSNSYAEIGFTNTQESLISECRSLFRECFDKTPLQSLRPIGANPKATLILDTLRICSLPLYSFFELNFPELLQKAPQKRVGKLLRQAPNELVTEFLRTAFLGDGYFSSGSFGYSTDSYGLANDYADLMLKLGIESSIQEEARGQKSYYKVRITGASSINHFLHSVLDKKDKRGERIKQVITTSYRKNNDRDVIPAQVVKQLRTLLLKFKCSQGNLFAHKIKSQNAHRATFEAELTRLAMKLEEINFALETSASTKKLRRLANIHVSRLADKLQVSTSTIYNIEASKNHQLYSNYQTILIDAVKEKLSAAARKVNYLRSHYVHSATRFVKITKIDKLVNEDQKWVYDVQIDPTHSFLSHGMVLHNTVTISKANIQATLRCETVVLAAANPKFGRFDPYELLAKQIDLPPALINRFDLIFPVRDLPGIEKDEKLASFVLQLHQSGDVREVAIETDLLRKYIVYAKSSCKPKLSDKAVQAIKKFYVEMRNSGSEGSDGITAIPISARQLEALVRLSEASAKSRLSPVADERDAQRAIDLLMHCLEQLGMDPDSGKMDIDRLTTGISASSRSNVHQIKKIIKELAELTGDSLVSEEEILAKAEEIGIDEMKAEEILEKLNRMGDVFRPKPGFYSMMK